MLELFTNPGYLAAGGALVSAPVIIHLINRMRFKRLQWAAMEFLLKSQKRNRRRLIIEQLILLSLRCLLVVLTALLVLRFVGLSLAGFQNQEGMHVVVLDDTLSMADAWKEGNEKKNCFQVAKDEVILRQIYKNVAQSTTNERLTIIPLSRLRLEPDFQPTVYSKLGEKATENEILKALEQLKPSTLHVPLVEGVKVASKLLGENARYRPVVHLVSDFRSHDWTGPDAQNLHKALLQLDQKGIAVWMRDCAYPYRVKDQGGQPRSNDNLAIVDFRASTRVVGKGMPVKFSVTVANFSPRDESLQLVIVDDDSGSELFDVDFNVPMPFKVLANTQTTVTFERRFHTIPENKQYHAQKLSARLQSATKGPLENDGLEADNHRSAAVEVREKVPILVIDGEGPRGRQENKDSFFLETAIISVPGASYEVKYGDELAGGSSPTKVLERADLSQYSSIYLLNVRELSPRQRENLESYVKEGGGVGFFLGPQVSGDYYTRELYRNGAGVFPLPIQASFHPPGAQEPLKPKFTGHPQLLLRSDLVKNMESLPVFGPIFKDPSQLLFLKDLPIRRYFQGIRGGWNPEPGRVIELATLPNENQATAYTRAALKLIEDIPLEKPEVKQYVPGLKKHIDAIRFVIAPGSEAKAFELARVLDAMLNDEGIKEDKGGYRADAPNLTEFFGMPEQRNLKADLESLRNSVLYGDPLVVAQHFGKGKVVAVLTTAGKDWNDWGGGSDASFLYQPVIWEMQNFLSSQGDKASLTPGSPVRLDVDINRFRKEGSAGKLFTIRTFYRPQAGQKPQASAEQPNYGVEGKEGVQSFTYERTVEPGFYQTELFSTEDPKAALAGWGHVYNVDALNEGKLQRVSQEQMEQLVLRSAVNKKIGRISGPVSNPDEVINRQTDLSESPWFFLLFLLVLVSEQALAVHLSFHLRNNEAALPAALAPQARAA